MSQQRWHIIHAETMTQNILGLAIAFIILKLWGMSTSDSLGLQAVFFIASYIRSYAVRRAFSRIK